MGVVIYKDSLTIWCEEKLRGLLLTGNEESTYATDQEYDSSESESSQDTSDVL